MMNTSSLRRAALLPIALCATLASVVPTAHAGEVLDKIKSTQTLTIGYRADYPPFSYAAPDGRIIGYAIDSCARIVGLMGKKLGMDIKLRYIPVTYSERMEAIRTGRIDLECADTTSTQERRKEFNVAFLSPYFITGKHMLVRSGIKKIADLKGKTLAYTANTTSGDISKRHASIWGVQVQACGPAASVCFKELEEGKIDAWMSDDITLLASRAASATPEQYRTLGDRISVEPLAPMYKAGDAELTAQLDAAMRQFMLSGEGRAIYRKWFEQPIAHKKINMQMPPSTLLQRHMRRPSSDVGAYRVMS